MRFTISYYLLILYAVVVIKPMIPVVGDKLSHEFNYMEHIATVHAMYGDNHMEKEVAATSDKEDSKSSPGIQKTEDILPFHLLSETQKHEPVAGAANIPLLLFQPYYIESVLLPVIAPPPRYSC